jgi:phage baseplate assembly protein W
VRLEESARIALRDWEARIRVRSVTAVPDPDLESKVNLTIEYDIPRTNSRRNLVFPFYLQGG